MWRRGCETHLDPHFSQLIMQVSKKKEYVEPIYVVISDNK